jgi:hypothetical protein
MRLKIAPVTASLLGGLSILKIRSALLDHYRSFSREEIEQLAAGLLQMAEDAYPTAGGEHA